MSVGIGGYRDLPPGDTNKGGSVRAPGEEEPTTEKMHADMEALQSVLDNLNAYGQTGWRAQDVRASEPLLVLVSGRLPAGFDHGKLKEYLRKLDARKKFRIVK